MTFMEPYDILEMTLAIALVISLITSAYLTRREERRAQSCVPMKAPLTVEVQEQLSRNKPIVIVIDDTDSMEDVANLDYRSYDAILQHHLKRNPRSASSSMLSFLQQQNKKQNDTDDIMGGEDLL